MKTLSGERKQHPKRKIIPEEEQRLRSGKNRGKRNEIISKDGP